MTLDQLFEGTQDKRDFLAGKLFTMSAQGNLLQIESPFGKAGDEHARNQVHRKMDRASRVLQKYCKEN